MLTKMTDEDWVLVLMVFDSCRSRRGNKGQDDRKFLEALHYFTVHNITWREQRPGVVRRKLWARPPFCIGCGIKSAASGTAAQNSQHQ
jgi:hypothetical protein